MKIIVEKSALVGAMSAAAQLIPSRSTIPILGHVKVCASDDTVTITANNTDAEISIRIPAQVDTIGATTIPGKMLAEAARNAPSASIELDVSDRATLRAGRSRTAMPTLPAEDFPEFPVSRAPIVMEWDAGQLAELLGTTAFAASTEETRYYLNGVHLHPINGMLRAVATDGHKLARLDSGIDARAMPSGVIVPNHGVAVLRKLLADATCMVGVSIGSTMRFAIGSTVYSTRLVEGTFPDYDRVIPSSHTMTTKVDSEALAAAINRVGVVSSDRSRAVRLDIAAGHIAVTSSDGASGADASDEVEAISTGTMQIGFNGAYLADILSCIGGMAECRVTEPGSPSVWARSGNDGLLIVLMPMRT